jgi:hypothetical protein
VYSGASAFDRATFDRELTVFREVLREPGASVPNTEVELASWAA